MRVFVILPVKTRTEVGLASSKDHISQRAVSFGWLSSGLNNWEKGAIMSLFIRHMMSIGLAVLVLGCGVVYADDDEPRMWSEYTTFKYDTDNDVVSNRRDQCPYSPPGAHVDSEGCPIDSDRDGVYNGLDTCPDTPEDKSVNSYGCMPSEDSDNDGVPNTQDACPNQGSMGHGVDSTGCPIPAPVVDSDGDGTPDSQDPCPNDPANSCLDSDGDGTPDGQDPCPNDPADACGGTGGGGGTGAPGGLDMVDDLNPDPEVCKGCHYDWERFPQLEFPGGPGSTLGAVHHVATNPIYAEKNCLGCHKSYIDGVTGYVEMDTEITESCGICHGAGGDYQAVGSPQTPNLHHFSETFQNGSCHTCHVLPETDLTSSEICAECHGGQVAQKNIIASFQQPYAHPLDALGRVAGNGDQVSCLDCHNPNQVTSSNLLKGVEGVEPQWPASWQAVTNFAMVQSVENQYQLCLKCHSYNKFGSNPPFDSIGKQMTDQALEFNPNNASHHAVAGPGKNDFKMTVGGVVYDYSGALVDGLTPNSTLVCSDCHGDADMPDVKGPHGSSIWPILKAPWTLNTGKGSTNDLCFKCHKPEVYGGVAGNVSDWKATGFSECCEYGKNLHQYHVYQKGWDCTDCHVKVPHGWKRKAFLYYNMDAKDPAPYNGQPNASWGIDVDTNVDSVESGHWAQQVCHDGNRHPGSCS